MIRRRKKNKGAIAKMNEVKKETYKDPVKKVYSSMQFDVHNGVDYVAKQIEQNRAMEM